MAGPTQNHTAFYAVKCARGPTVGLTVWQVEVEYCEREVDKIKLNRIV
jgi:hypothetical protein